MFLSLPLFQLPVLNTMLSCHKSGAKNRPRHAVCILFNTRFKNRWKPNGQRYLQVGGDGIITEIQPRGKAASHDSQICPRKPMVVIFNPATLYMQDVAASMHFF